jgi:hypothetical protein
LLFHLPGHFGELGVRGGRLCQDAEQRSDPGVDAGLGGRVQLELAPWIGLGDDGLDGWPLIGRAFRARRATSDGGLDHGLEQAALPPKAR